MRNLTDVTGEHKPESLTWTEEQQKAFMKHCLRSNVVLVRAVLTQCDSKGNERPVYFISQKLMVTQQDWATTEKKAYIIVWALSK